MTERPTPETDAMLYADWNKLEEYSAPLSAYRRMTALCRTLEGERDEARAQLAAERALADRLGQSLLRLSGMSPLIYAHAMDDLAAWKEARND